ncbi:hypothetical protein ABEH00_20025 [Pantoea agglomerans]|uniref:hypothetical protein n=1 Tax=Enterobacter agglomerans TaxID=549 RepID=UPI001654311D|nr:hypothetical protein [Pantoea agglomerans]
MGFFDSFKDVFGSDKEDNLRGIISNGPQKIDGGHDHRYNKGSDRTPSQKEGDKKRSQD